MEIVKFYQEGGGDVWEKMGTTEESTPVLPAQEQVALGPPRSKRPALPKSATQSNVAVDDRSSPYHGSASSPNWPPALRGVPVPLNPTLSRSDTAKESIGMSDRRVANDQQSLAQQPPHKLQPLQILPTQTKSKVKAKSQPSFSNSPTDPRIHQKPNLPIHRAQDKPEMGRNSSLIPTRWRKEKEKDAESSTDIARRFQQICTDADPTRLYRNLVKIEVGRVASCIQPGRF